MFGQVVETGKSVTQVKQGDYAVFTVRRKRHIGASKC
jgi:D-arabinose 1-dehydrogenase-like Zn-dependent alcohol dehydrogenase